MSHKTAATVAHTIGIDTGKNTLHLIGLDDIANVPRCLIGIEAGMATHYVARELSAGGNRFAGEDCTRPDHSPARCGARQTDQAPV